MNKKLKIGLIVAGVVGLTAASFFAIKFYTLRKAYSKQLSPEDVMKLIDEKTKNIGTEMEEDPDLPKGISGNATDDSTEGYYYYE